MPKFRHKVKTPPEDPFLAASARRLAQEIAREEYGAGGFCRQVVRNGDSRVFWCHIAHQPGRPGDLVGKMVRVTVP